MRAFYIAVCVLVIAYGSINNSHAMRCKGKLILKGDSVLKLVSNCGRPLYSDFIIKNGRMIRMFIYKEKYSREKRVFLRNGTVIGVVE